MINIKELFENVLNFSKKLKIQNIHTQTTKKNKTRINPLLKTMDNKNQTL